MVQEPDPSWKGDFFGDIGQFRYIYLFVLAGEESGAHFGCFLQDRNGLEKKFFSIDSPLQNILSSGGHDWTAEWLDCGVSGLWCCKDVTFFAID